MKTCGMGWDRAEPIRDRIFGAPLPGDMSEHSPVNTPC
jgi:hypothetical protein